METTPDITGVAGLMGDRARATMLMSLMAGQALTATELARSAGVTKQTASGHLGKLLEARLLAVEQAGRHRYFRLAGPEVGSAIEGLVALAGRTGVAHPPRVRTGPVDPGLRKARVCYDHLAGELGVVVFESLTDGGAVAFARGSPALTTRGEAFCAEFGIDAAELRRGRRPVCLACLDWSERRHHLAGALGAAILDRVFELKWARRDRTFRTIVFSVVGERALRDRFRSRGSR
jgi:DNA-binding transcriptional ArsR family regulator